MQETKAGKNESSTMAFTYSWDLSCGPWRRIRHRSYRRRSWGLAIFTIRRITCHGDLGHREMSGINSSNTTLLTGLYAFFINNRSGALPSMNTIWSAKTIYVFYDQRPTHIRERTSGKSDVRYFWLAQAISPLIRRFPCAAVRCRPKKETARISEST